MMQSADQLAELFLTMVGPIKPNEQKLHQQDVVEMIAACKSRLLANDIEKGMATGTSDEIEPVWFSERILEPVYNEMRDWYEAKLPNGCMNLPFNVDIRVSPMRGTLNPFVWLPMGFCANAPDLAYCEGNIGVELHPPATLVFPTLQAGILDKIVVHVIEPGIADPSEPLQMLSKYSTTIWQMLLDFRNASFGEDSNTNWKEDAPR